MAVNAYVLLNARPGTVKNIVGRLIETKGVKQAHACWGRPDIFCYVEAPDLKTLTELVLNRIQSYDGVESTDTHIVSEF